MKISILCNDLSNKALGRAFVIGKALEKKYEVKIIGPIYGDDIWYPFRHSFNYVTFKGYYNPFFPLQLKNYLKNIDGELIFAIKPHINSFGVALFLKMTRKIPLILDIDDWEFGFALSQGFWNMIKIFHQELIRPEEIGRAHV